MENADLYFDEIDLSRYFSDNDCRKCGAASCKDLVDKIRTSTIAAAELDRLPPDKAARLKPVLESGQLIPQVPKLQMPRPGFSGLMELNNPEPGNPVLITGNSQLTQDVMLAALSTTVSPFFLVLADTHGDSLDMAVILGSFTPETVEKALTADDVPNKIGTGLVIPGRAAHLREEIKAVCSLTVENGPVCAAELPLFFGEQWKTV